MSNLTRETGGGHAPPQVWWSPELGLIWQDGNTYRRTEGERVVEFFHLPPHARTPRPVIAQPCYCCGAESVLCQTCADMTLEDASA